MARVKVYTASKLDQLGLWQRLAVEWPEVQFTARWVKNGVTPELDARADRKFLTKAWQENLEDVLASDIVLVLPPPDGQHLRGALVEVGVALGAGKRVLLMSDHDDYGTWQNHPLVFKAHGVKQARTLLYMIAEGLQ